MNRTQRQQLKDRAFTLLTAFREVGDHTSQRLIEIAIAALDYGASQHTLDSNCSAGDCDSCSAKDALAKLEALIGGPVRVHGIGG